MKRKEREYNKLKERLHQLVMNKKDKKLGKYLFEFYHSKISIFCMLTRANFKHFFH